MQKHSNDLTTGSVTKQLLLFALPILLGQLFQNLYNSVDSIVVGRAVSTEALAAVSISSDVTHLITGFFTGFSVGAGVLFSRAFGAKDNQRLHDAIHTSVTFSVILGVVMAAAGILATPLIMTLVDCPADVLQDAIAYLRVYLVGILFTAIYNIGAGILRSVGDSRSPFIYLVIASVINIVLDVVLVVFLHWGVVGAAVATVISQLVSVTLTFRRLMITAGPHRLYLRHLRIDKKLLLEIVDLGIPAAIQSALINISNLFVARYVNSFDTPAVAGIGAAKKIDKFIGMVAQAIGQATATFVSQNLGAKRLDRAFKSIRVSVVFNMLYVLVFGSTIYAFADVFVGIFTNDQQAAVYGIEMVRTLMPLFFLQSLNQIYANAARGFGKSRAAMVCSIAGMIGCRQIFLAITMNIDWNVRFIYIGYPVGWGCAALFAVAYFYFAVYRKYRPQLKAAHSGI